MPDSPPAFTSYGSGNVGSSMGNYVDAVTNPDLLSKLYGAEAQGNQQYTGLETQQTNQLLFGDQNDFDVGALWNSLSDAERADYEQAGASQGITGDEWLKRTAIEQAQRGDQTWANKIQQFRKPGSQGLIGQYGQATKAIGDIEAGANTAARQATLADIQNLGGQANAAYRNSNPEMQAAMQRAEQMGGPGNFYGGLSGAVNGAQQYGDVQGGQLQQGQLGQSLYNQALGANGLGQVGQSLQNRALGFSNSTGELSADEMRNLQQSTREAYAARGTEMGSGAVSAEALSRLTGQRERMLQDLGIASSLNQAGQQELGANRAFAQGVYGQELGRQGQNIATDLATQESNRSFGFGQQQQGIQNQALLGQLMQGQQAQDRGYAMNLAQMQQGIGQSAFNSVMGTQSGALGYGTGASQFASGLAGTNIGPQMFDPAQGVNIDMANASNKGTYDATVYGADQALAGAKAGASATKSGGILGAVGSIFGGPIGGAIGGALGGLFKCWVAREVYGTEDGKWLQFREWLLRKAPRWFYKLYCKHGPAFAEWLKNKPRTKKLIKFWMDGRIATMKEINSRSAEEIS